MAEMMISPPKKAPVISENFVTKAREMLEASGYTVLKTKSYLSAQERQRRAQCQLEWAKREAESSREWARNCLTEERRIRDRLTFIYAKAIAAGLTRDDLVGDTVPGIPYIAIGNSEPLPEGLPEALADFIRPIRTAAGYCDHGLRFGPVCCADPMASNPPPRLQEED